MSPQVSRFIDMARWVAALAVLITHVNANALVTLADIPPSSRGLTAYLVWFFYGFAHQAVVIFFVLSGFLVGGGVIRSARSGRRFLGGYMVDRTARIYIVLVPVLVLTALLDAIGRTLFADTHIYAEAIFSGHSQPTDFLANMLGLQDIFFPYFGTNSALWTLAHEYWYYVTFALLALPLSDAYSPRARRAGFALGAALLVGLSISGSYHLFGFVLWLAGAAAALVPQPLLRSSRLALAAFIALSIGLRLFVRYSLVEIWWIGGLADFVIALGFASLLLTLRFDIGPVWRACRSGMHAKFSDFSYSLYALHMPVVIFLCAAAQHWLGAGWHSIPDSAARWLLAAAILLAAAAASWLFSRQTEARTPALRRFLRGMLEQESRKAGVSRLREPVYPSAGASGA